MELYEKKMSLWFNDFVLDNGEIIFSSGSVNGLFRSDIYTGKAKLIGRFPGEDMFGNHLYYNSHRYKDHILFVPAWARRFALYNMKDNSFHMFLPEEIGDKKHFKYLASVLADKYVYVFGDKISSIIRIDMETLEVIYYSGWLEKLYQFGNNEENAFFFKDVCVVGKSLFLVTGKNNSIVELNMNEDKIYIHPVGKKGSVYNTIVFDGKSLWLTEQTKGFLKVNMKNWEYQYWKIENPIQTDCFVSSLMINNEVLLFSNQNEALYVINCKDPSIRRWTVQFDKSDVWYPRNDKFGYRFAKQLRSELAVFCAQDCQLHFLKQNEDIRRVKFFTSDLMADVCEKNFRKMKNARTIYESNIKFYQLEDFLLFLRNVEEESGDYERQDCGKTIYSCIR